MGGAAIADFVDRLFTLSAIAQISSEAVAESTDENMATGHCRWYICLGSFGKDRMSQKPLVELLGYYFPSMAWRELLDTSSLVRRSAGVRLHCWPFPSPLSGTLTRRRKTLCRSLGYSFKDLISVRSLALGIACAGACGLLVSLVNFILATTHADVIPTLIDELRHSMNYLGDAALPVHLALSCIIAPYVEEIVFRRFS